MKNPWGSLIFYPNIIDFQAKNVSKINENQWKSMKNHDFSLIKSLPPPPGARYRRCSRAKFVADSNKSLGKPSDTIQFTKINVSDSVRHARSLPLHVHAKTIDFLWIPWISYDFHGFGTKMWKFGIFCVFFCSRIWKCNINLTVDLDSSHRFL